jgi:hypothetical protein
MSNKTKRSLVFIFLAFWLAACTLPARIKPTSTAMPSATPEVQRVVTVALGVRGSAQFSPEVTAGNTIVVEASFTPVVQAITRRADGNVESSSSTPWEDAPLAQMRICLSVEPQPCELGEWQPFQPQYSQEIHVDWLGPRQFNSKVEFADAAGQPIPSVRAYYYDAQPQTSLSMTVLASIDPGTPLAQLPAPVQTAVAATQTAYPVTGSVVIEEGRCCAGGRAGSTIQLRVDFQASSRVGEVTEMKVQVGQCIHDPAELNASWEAYQAQRTFETTLAINWVGWWVSVQYRDSAGNLSPVYCDDISLEGSPANP